MFGNDFGLVNPFNLISSDAKNSSDPKSKKANSDSPFYPKTLDELPKKVKEALTGSLLGDGYIGYNHKKNGIVKGNASFEFSHDAPG